MILDAVTVVHDFWCRSPNWIAFIMRHCHFCLGVDGLESVIGCIALIFEIFFTPKVRQSRKYWLQCCMQSCMIFLWKCHSDCSNPSTIRVKIITNWLSQNYRIISNFLSPIANNPRPQSSSPNRPSNAASRCFNNLSLSSQNTHILGNEYLLFSQHGTNLSSQNSRNNSFPNKRAPASNGPNSKLWSCVWWDTLYHENGLSALSRCLPGCVSGRYI